MEQRHFWNSQHISKTSSPVQRQGPERAECVLRRCLFIHTAEIRETKHSSLKFTAAEMKMRGSANVCLRIIIRQRRGRRPRAGLRSSPPNTGLPRGTEAGFDLFNQANWMKVAGQKNHAEPKTRGHYCPAGYSTSIWTTELFSGTNPTAELNGAELWSRADR